MSNDDAPGQPARGTPAQGLPRTLPLSWPPPGLERMQGALWRVVGLAWSGSLLLVLPLLWALAVEQPFYSLGPFEDDWRLGIGIAAVGGGLVIFAFWQGIVLLGAAAHGARLGYGRLTLAEVAIDTGRDTGFLIQGKRHFGSLDERRQRSVIRSRIVGAVALLGAAFWLVLGFGLAILLAARGLVTPSGIWLLTVGPAAVLAFGGGLLTAVQNTTVRALQSEWKAREGMERIGSEAAAWNAQLDGAGASIALGGGPRGDAPRIRLLTVGAILCFVVGFAPIATVAMTSAIGPILADIAVPTFLAVQEMAGGAEVLRRFDVAKDDGVTAERAGEALQNIAFVGVAGVTDPMERAPRTAYDTPWFPTSDFPDAYSDAVAADLMRRPLEGFSESEQAALEQAARHPAHDEFHLLARAATIDVVRGRWTLPFPDSLTFQDLPWPRFQAIRTAGLAQVARAAIEVEEGRPDDAEHTLRELIATGFLLVDEGPTLLDNLVGVELTRMGADGLEGFYLREGQPDRAEALAWARAGATAAAGRARAGLLPEDARALLQGVPDLVEDDTALRGLRWEYFATFNLLGPCINLNKMVFGPDDSYDEWRDRAERAIVRLPGEAELFDLAEHGAIGSGARETTGFVPRLLDLVLGSSGAPGSCASLIASLQS